MIGKTNVPPSVMYHSMIIVTAPTGSTVTCSNGSIVKTATERNGTWTFRGILTGTWTVTATKNGLSTSKTITFTRLEVEYVTLIYRSTPEFTYSGSCQIVRDDDTAISDFASYIGNWKIRFLTSGTLKFTNLHNWNGRVDAFLVGGGGGTAPAYPTAGYSNSGAGGGYTATKKSLTVSANQNYTVAIGAGGAAGTNGGTSSFLSASAAGGKMGGDGGSGGGGSGSGDTWAGGQGGSNGSDGTQGYNPGGKGQGSTTKEFGEASGIAYSGGGGGGGAFNIADGGATGGGKGGNPNTQPTGGTANTGGGAGGWYTYPTSGAAGGSGIVIIRNAR